MPEILVVPDRDKAAARGVNMAVIGDSLNAMIGGMRIGKELLPDGYRLLLSGSSQTFQDSFGSLLTALVLGVFVAYMVLGAQFNSFLHPFTVLLVVPCAYSLMAPLESRRHAEALKTALKELGETSGPQ